MTINRVATAVERAELQEFFDTQSFSCRIPGPEFDHIVKPYFYTARVDGRIVAALASHQADAAIQANRLIAGHSWLGVLATDSGFRGQRYASGLIVRAERDLVADGVRYWFGCVSQDHDDVMLRGFYERHGFTVLPDGQHLPRVLDFDWSAGSIGGRAYSFPNARFFGYKRLGPSG